MATTSVVVDSRTTPFLDLTASPILPTPSFDSHFTAQSHIQVGGSMDPSNSNSGLEETRMSPLGRRMPTPFARVSMSLPFLSRSPAANRSEGSPRRQSHEHRGGEAGNSAGPSNPWPTLDWDMDQAAAADGLDAAPPSVVPQRRRRESIEVIDVDSIDDDDEVEDPPAPTRVIPGTHTRTGPRIHSGDGPSPAQRRRVDPSEVILIESSDEDEDHGDAVPPPRAIAGPSRFRPVRYPTGRVGMRLFSPPPPPQSSINIPPVPAVPGPLRPFQSIPLRRRLPPLPSPSSFSPAPGPSQASSSSAGPVRPLNEPYDFEANLRATRAANRNALARSVSPPMRAAPPSHHAPSMGLGGALISTHREQMRNDRIRNTTARSATSRNRLHRLYDRITAYRPTINFLALGRYVETDDDDDLEGRIQGLHALVREDHQARLLWGLDDADWNYDAAFEFGAGRIKRPEMEYKPDYTHKKPVESGFTYDFEPAALESPKVKKPLPPPPPRIPISSASDPIIIDDDDEEDGYRPVVVDKGKGKAREEDMLDDALQTPSAGSSHASQSQSHSQPLPTSRVDAQPPSPTISFKTLLVCARCLDPLILNSGQLKDEKEQHTRRVWGLRCGHMIDGKCLEEISRPVEAKLLPELQPEPSESKGKGKAVDQGTEQADAEVEDDAWKGEEAGEPDPGEHQDTERVEESQAKKVRKGRRKGGKKGRTKEKKGPRLPSGVALSADDATAASSSSAPATNASPLVALEDVVPDTVLPPVTALTPDPSPSRSRLRPRNPLTGLASVPSSILSPSSSAFAPSTAAPSSSSTSGRVGLQLPGMYGIHALPPNPYHLWDTATGPSTSSSSAGPSLAQTKRKRKGKAQVRKPKLEEIYTWTCPVPNCGKEHTSLKVDGVWIQEKGEGKGAIQVFV
ncbi:hypothetical protein BDN72DRAFT_834984 [Pluteus cervinus]|uniref:Uncharacterized protein n=1 Tax=Pluteus cervinus TaxID=181527 RepID=A0ACD3B6I2_9AGAR|nr:hypothetical protein BDN72DRAFT_834984 [Pluteus cervinus]